MQPPSAYAISLKYKGMRMNQNKFTAPKNPPKTKKQSQKKETKVSSGAVVMVYVASHLSTILDKN